MNLPTLLLLAALVPPAVGAQAEPTEIVAGVPARFPPHYQLDRRTGQPAGFAIDVLDEVARRCGLKIRYRVYPDWSPVLAAVKNGEIDVIPNLGITPERTAFIDFTVPYETFDIAIFVRATSVDIKGAEDLTGRSVAVVADNIGQPLMEQRGGTLLQVHQTQEQAFMALLSGEADALVYPEPVVRMIAREIGVEERIRQVGSPLAEVKRAIGVRKGQPALLGKLGAEVKSFTGSPAFREIYGKWYGTPEPYWTVRRTALGLGALLLAAVAVLVLWRYRSIAQLNERLRLSLAERERAEAAMRETGELLALFMRHSPMYVYIKEVTPTESRVLHASENFVQMIGIRGSEMAGKTMAELFPAEFAAKITADDWAVASSGRVLNLEEELNGRIYDTIKFPMVRGDRILLAGYTMDITERKHAEAALKEAESAKSELLEKMNESQHLSAIGSWDWNMENNHVWWSDETYRIFGVNPQDYVPSFEGNGKFIHPDDFGKYGAVFEQSLQTGEPLDVDLRLVAGDGLLKHCNAKGQPLFDDSGKPIRFIGTIMDITGRKAAEVKMTRLSRLYSVLFKVNEDIVRLKDPEDLYESICRIVIEDGLFRMAWIGIVDPKTLWVDPVAKCGVEEGYLTMKRISANPALPEGRGQTSIAIRSGAPRIVNDIQSDPAMRPWREEALRRGYRSSAAFPLRKADRVVGSLNIYAAEPHHFQADEIQLLETLAADVSYALMAMEEERQRKQAETQLRILNVELAAINRIIAACAGGLDAQAILEKVLDEALDLAGLEGGTICMVTPDETLHLAAHRETSAATIRDLTENVIKIGECLCGECARDRRPLILRDRAEVLKYATREATRGEEILFHAAFPLVVKERCLGVLCVFTRTDRKPREGSLKQLETATAQIALALENAQLYETTVRHAAELEERVKARTADLEAKIAEIERINRLFVGRELAMVELKKRIKELEKDDGRRGT